MSSRSKASNKASKPVESAKFAPRSTAMAEKQVNSRNTVTDSSRLSGSKAPSKPIASKPSAPVASKGSKQSVRPSYEDEEPLMFDTKVTKAQKNTKVVSSQSTNAPKFVSATQMTIPSKGKKAVQQVSESEEEDSEDFYGLEEDEDEDSYNGIVGYGFGDEDEDEDGYEDEDEDYENARAEALEELVAMYQGGIISQDQFFEGLEDLSINPVTFAKVLGAIQGDEDEDEDEDGMLFGDEDGMMFGDEDDFDDDVLEDDDDEDESEMESKSSSRPRTLGEKRGREFKKISSKSQERKESAPTKSGKGKAIDDDLDDLDDEEVYDFKLKLEAEEAEKEAQRLQDEIKEKQIDEYLARKKEELRKVINERQKAAHYRRLHRRAFKKEDYNNKYSIKSTYVPFKFNK